MEEIINKLWEEHQGQIAKWVGIDPLAEKHIFKQGCKAILAWQAEQDAMDRDYQEEMNQNTALMEGDA